MPRKPRFFVADIPTHVVQRGNNRQAIFFAESDHRAYLRWLKESANRWSCDIHAYVLMTNHVHLLATPRDSTGISRMMQYVGRRYVPYINHKYQRSGTLWEGRFKASLIQTQSYLLACCRYIELNPVRARITAAPGGYPWSSYRHNALGEKDPLLTTHPEYRALGGSAKKRRAAYQALFTTELEPKLIAEMRACVQTGTPLGNERFREQIEKTLGRTVGYTRRGRPRRPDDEAGAESADAQLPLADT